MHPNGDVECRVYETRSFTVAERSRDALCLSVAQSFIISYFGFLRFTCEATIKFRSVVFSVTSKLPAVINKIR